MYITGHYNKFNNISKPHTSVKPKCFINFVYLITNNCDFYKQYG